MRLSSSQSQITMFDVPPDEVVNVASVRQLSPFRYPGGKTWFVPRVRQWLASIGTKPKHFVEPFAGGAIVGLNVACERLAENVVLCELDAEVAAVWESVLSESCSALVKRILEFDCSLPHVLEEVKKEGGSLCDIAFRTILKNRTFHGGILAKGSSPMKSGENGRGVASRWYPETLARRIKTINSMRDRILFVHGDAIKTIENYSKNPDAVFFVDPPYTAAGKKAGNRLYNHHELDHGLLFDTMRSVVGDFVMTYDLSDELVELAISKGFQSRPVAMKNTHNAEMSEAVIGRNLAWLR